MSALAPAPALDLIVDFTAPSDGFFPFDVRSAAGDVVDSGWVEAGPAAVSRAAEEFGYVVVGAVVVMGPLSGAPVVRA